MSELNRIREPLRRTLNGLSAEWPSLVPAEVSTLVEQGVAPLIYANARVPELREEAVRAAAVEPLRLADLRLVLEALAASGVSAILMKGTALAYDLYEQPELRPRVDTDLLIDRNSFSVAREVFLRLGFEEQVTSGDELAIRQRMYVRVDRHGLAHTYDVHWAVANSALFCDVLRFDEIRAVALPAIGAGARALPLVEALLLACVHRIAHHHDEERLIWLVDIAKLRARLPEPARDRFRQLAEERRVAAICARSFAVTDEWLGAGDWTVEPSSREEPSRVFLDRELTYGAMTLANLRVLPWAARWTRLRQLAFPPVAYMQRSFRARSRVPLPILYVLRGVRGFRRLLGKASEQ